MSDENSVMDYKEHRQTFSGFTKAVKYSIILAVIFLVFFRLVVIG